MADDFTLRVFFDKLNETFLQLFTHRFGSHVCQTLFILAADAVEREVRGESGADAPVEKSDDHGTLLSMEVLVLNMCKQTHAEFPTLISDPFASHIIRVIFGLLSGSAIGSDESGRSVVRSKKSVKYIEEHNNRTAQEEQRVKRLVPDSFKEMLQMITKFMMDSTNDVIIRSLAVHQVASPVIQLLLEAQAKTNSSADDFITNYLLTGIAEDDRPDKAGFDCDAYVETLIRDAVGSHVFQKILQLASSQLFHKIYTTYFRGRLCKLCMHPVANYVIQQLFTSAKTKVQLVLMVEEAIPEFENFLKHHRSGVIRSIIESSRRLQTCYKEVIKGLCAAFHSTTTTQRKEFVNLVITMQNYEDWTQEREDPENIKKSRRYNVQGALILQMLLAFPEEHNKIVVDSYLSQPDSVRLEWSRDPVASRVIESFLTSPTVPLKVKSKLVKMFLNHYHTLAMDTYGGHIVDKLWVVADIDMKEKIAAELLANEHALSESYYGRFVLRNCKINHFKRKREEWLEQERGIERKKEMFKDLLGDMVSGSPSIKTDFPEPNLAMATLGFTKGMSTVPNNNKKKSKKHKARGNNGKMLMEEEGQVVKHAEKYKKDEIDVLFKKKKRSKKEENVDDIYNKGDIGKRGEESDGEVINDKSHSKKVDKKLDAVLDAISATKKKKTKVDNILVVDAESSGTKSKLKNKKVKIDKKPRKFES